jgi:hypothetical protein
MISQECELSSIEDPRDDEIYCTTFVKTKFKELCFSMIGLCLDGAKCGVVVLWHYLMVGLLGLIINRGKR